MYLPPSSFPNVPRSFAEELEAAGCKIPTSPNTNNIIRGEFATPGQTDWAVLCSQNRRSTIRLFWGGPAICSATLAEVEDASLLHKARGGIEYARTIQSLGKAQVRRDYRAPPSGQMGPIEHDGVGDGFLAAVEVVYYCEGDEWKELSKQR
jgi:hypothetical protein